MAAAKKCDRCGKFYEKNTRFSTFSSFRRTLLDGICFTTMNGGYVEYSDLCDDCIAELKLFLNGKKLRED